MSAEHNNEKPPATNPQPPPVQDRKSAQAEKYPHDQEIVCPVCKNSKAVSLGAVVFPGKTKEQTTVIVNYHCAGCGANTEVTLAQ